MLTVAIAHSDLKTLQRLSDSSGSPISSVLHEAIAAYDRKELLREANEEYTAIRNDPREWEEELRERKLFEATLMDGLDGDE